MAFDTTVLGLLVAAVALIVSTIRKSWYAKYMAAFEAATECTLEWANGNHEVQVPQAPKQEKAPAPQIDNVLNPQTEQPISAASSPQAQ